jgi:hypothetical protein
MPNRSRTPFGPTYRERRGRVQGGEEDHYETDICLMRDQNTQFAKSGPSSLTLGQF